MVIPTFGIVLCTNLYTICVVLFIHVHVLHALVVYNGLMVYLLLTMVS